VRSHARSAPLAAIVVSFAALASPLDGNVDADAPDRRERIAEGVDRAHQCGDRHILGIAYEQLARLELHEGNTRPPSRQPSERSSSTL